MCVYFRSCLHTCYKCMCMYIHMKTWGQPCVFLNHVPPNFWGRFSHWISLIELARLARKHQGPSCLHSLSTGIAPAAFYMGVGFWMPLLTLLWQALELSEPPPHPLQLNLLILLVSPLSPGKRKTSSSHHLSLCKISSLSGSTCLSVERNAAARPGKLHCFPNALRIS